MSEQQSSAARGVSIVALLATLAVTREASAQVVFVDDALKGAKPTGRDSRVTAGARGGRFGLNGWTVTGDVDTVWYAIDAPLPRGRVEVELTGLGLRTNLTGGLHDVFVMYGKTTRPEPVPYFSHFRDNDFKTQIRIMGSQVKSRPHGATKVEMRMCPAGSPGYHDPCPRACTDQVKFSYMGGVKAQDWNAKNVYRLIVEWQPGKMTYRRLVNGKQVDPVATIAFSGSYAPGALRVRLGSPRHTKGSPERMPTGATFRRVKITGWPGAVERRCGARPDAGPPRPDRGIAPLPPPDAGSPPDARAAVDVATTADAARALDLVTADDYQWWSADATVSPADGLAGGCACDASGKDSAPQPLLLLAISALALRRRRCRTRCD